MADLIDSTATHVRVRNEPIHHLEHATTKPFGREYLTVCGARVRARGGAVLTTTPAACPECADELAARKQLVR